MFPDAYSGTFYGVLAEVGIFHSGVLRSFSVIGD